MSKPVSEKNITSVLLYLTKYSPVFSGAVKKLFDGMKYCSTDDGFNNIITTFLDNIREICEITKQSDKYYIVINKQKIIIYLGENPQGSRFIVISYLDKQEIYYYQKLSKDISITSFG